MKDLYIVANWKENKTKEEALVFLEEFSDTYKPKSGVTTIICPPYLLVPVVSEFIKSKNIGVVLGVQDISKFDGGAHTGEVSAREASEFAKFSIIGHSERRSLGETDEDVEVKVMQALKNNIKPIVCVINENVPVPSGVTIVAYEPIEAIGTGNPDTPENAEKVAASIKAKNNPVKRVLYGGSVTSDNVVKFIAMESVDGVLVGGASLNASSFVSLIDKC